MAAAENDRTALERPEVRDRLAAAVDALPRCSYSLDPTTHYDVITHQLREVLARICPASKNYKTWWRSYLSDGTIDIIQYKAIVHKSLNVTNRLVGFTNASAAWNVWMLARGAGRQWLSNTPEGNIIGSFKQQQYDAAWYAVEYGKA